MNIFIILGLLIFSGKLVTYICEKIHLPAVTGMIALGILLGPTVFGLIRPGELTSGIIQHKLKEFHEKDEQIESLEELFPHEMNFEIVHFLSLIGVAMLLFLAGLETDLHTLARSGKASLMVAFGGLILPFIMGYFLAIFFAPGNFQRAFLIGAILTATSVSVSAMSLISLKKIRSREGTTILTAAIIDDVIGIIILSFVLAFISGNRNELILSIILIGVYSISAVLIGWFIVPFIMNLSKKINVSHGVNAIAFSLMLVFAGIAEISCVAGITGAYLAGLFISRTQFRHSVREGIETLGYTLFIPLFFIFIGLQINLRVGPYNWLFIILFILVAIMGKIVGSGIMAKLSGYSLRKSFVIGSGMVPRGEVALVIASIGLHYSNIIDSSTFTATVILVIVSSFITPILLEKGFGNKEKKDA